MIGAVRKQGGDPVIGAIGPVKNTAGQETPKNQEIRILWGRETPKNQELKILGVQETPKNQELKILEVQETPKNQ